MGLILQGIILNSAYGLVAKRQWVITYPNDTTFSLSYLILSYLILSHATDTYTHPQE